MSFKWSWVVVLALLAWSAAMARPSDAVVSPTESLLDKDSVLNACLSTRPHTFATTQQLSGNWCGLENSNQSITNDLEVRDVCDRYTFAPDGERLGLKATMVRRGQSINIDVTLSKIENGSWITTEQGRTSNFFIGFSADGQNLHMCGTSVRTGRRPQEVMGVALKRCSVEDAAPAEQCNTQTTQA